MDSLVANASSWFSSRRNVAFVIAEIGGNHEGDFEYAKRLTALAIASGVDAVKFQIYRGDRLVSAVADPQRNLHFKRFELRKEEYLYLAEMCRAAGVQFMASVWDLANLEWAEGVLRIHKVGSGDFTAFPIIRRLVSSGKPIIFSVGLCTVAEIEHTLDFIGSCDSTYLREPLVALLQCTTAYPCPPEYANLSVIPELKRQFGLPVGYSDHTIGMQACLAAVTLGAEIIEKHFTDVREGKQFRDHLVSTTKAELQQFLTDIEKIGVLKGTSTKAPTEAEISAGHLVSFRRSVYAAKNIMAGDVLTEENLTVLRPQVGIPASEYDSLLGLQAKHNISEDEPIQRENLIWPSSSDVNA
jgi:N,N'-diacetyllegionaminate synthase